MKTLIVILIALAGCSQTGYHKTWHEHFLTMQGAANAQSRLATHLQHENDSLRGVIDSLAVSSELWEEAATDARAAHFQDSERLHQYIRFLLRQEDK